MNPATPPNPPTDPLAHLDLLTHNRFALRQHPDLQGIRHALITAYSIHATPLQPDAWWLIGTDGCHLCELAEHDIMQVKGLYPLPDLQVLEILEFDASVIQIFSPLLPILITPTSLLTYPFGVMDIISIKK